MAITVSHQPDFGLLARAGYYVGAGEDMRWRSEMALRERMQERALNANLMSQQLANYNSMQRMAFGSQIDQQQQANQFGQRAALQKDAQQFERQMRELEVQDRMDRIQTDWKNRKMMQQLEFSNSQEADQNKFLFQQADESMSAIRSLIEDGFDFEPQDQQKYQSAVREVGKIMEDETLTPTAKAQAVYKITESLPIPSVRVPNVEEIIHRDVIEKDVEMPNGQIVKALLSLDRDGRPRLLGSFEPDKPDSPGGTIADQVQADPATYLKYRAQAVKELSGSGEMATIPDEGAIDKRVQEMISHAPGGQQNGKSETKPASKGKSVKRFTYDPATGQLNPK